ncbi:MAG TPA: FAD-binding protein, partial [Candidatus Angelobacter sp.]|nr:FAD-binding protein [Candidatus Angelobacter sp.]
MNPRQNKALFRLRRALSDGELRFDQGVLQAHSGDKWFASRLPDAVALPRSTHSVATVLRFAHRHGVPVTARGAGYGYVGGCVPSRGGIALSLAQMNRIKEINPLDFVAIA